MFHLFSTQVGNNDFPKTAICAGPCGKPSKNRAKWRPASSGVDTRKLPEVQEVATCGNQNAALPITGPAFLHGLPVASSHGTGAAPHAGLLWRPARKVPLDRREKLGFLERYLALTWLSPGSLLALTWLSPGSHLALTWLSPDCAPADWPTQHIRNWSMAFWGPAEAQNPPFFLRMDPFDMIFSTQVQNNDFPKTAICAGPCGKPSKIAPNGPTGSRNRDMLRGRRP